MTKQYYELTDSKSAKFWEVEQQDSVVKLRWGKIGTNGQSKIKELDSQEDAKKEVERLIKQKTKKGYVEADAMPTYQEDKDNIKASIAKLKRKNRKFKADCIANDFEITGWVEDHIKTVEELCKLLENLSNCSDIYHSTQFINHSIIEQINSAELVWMPITTKCKDIKNVKRDADMFGCFPWTSKSYPWPENGYAAPGMQIDLRNMNKLIGGDLFDDGLLQVWFNKNENYPCDPVIRIIPRSVLEKEKPDTVFHSFKAEQLKVADTDFLRKEGIKNTGSFDFFGWIIKDYDMRGMQIDESFAMMEESLQDRNYGEFSDKTILIADEVSSLAYRLEEKAGYFFGVPYVGQMGWSDDYARGYRNLFSFVNEYFDLGIYDGAQLMYKKEDGEISFSFEASFY
jgi:predicted DNA-binding WGR domain protein